MIDVNPTELSLRFPKKIACAGAPIGDPREVVREVGTGTSYISPREPWDWCNNVIVNHNNDGFVLTEHQDTVGDPYRTEKQSVTQKLSADGKTKVTTIRPQDAYARNTKGSFQMIQTLAEDGTYECRRVGNGAEHVKEIKPIEGRKALTGFAGKIEKALMCIAQDANGCERPVVNKIAGKLINTLRRVR